MPKQGPIVDVHDLREHVATLLALALQAQERGNIDISELLVALAVHAEDAATDIENAAELRNPSPSPHWREQRRT